MHITRIVTMILLITDILVGFERNFTSINESLGSFELCVEIFTDPLLLPASFDFSLNLITIPGTAGISYRSIKKGDNVLTTLSSSQVLLTLVRLLPPTILLCPSPLIPLLIDSVSMSQSLMMQFWRARRGLA